MTDPQDKVKQDPTTTPSAPETVTTPTPAPAPAGTGARAPQGSIVSRRVVIPPDARKRAAPATTASDATAVAIESTAALETVTPLAPAAETLPPPTLTPAQSLTPATTATTPASDAEETAEHDAALGAAATAAAATIVPPPAAEFTAESSSPALTPAHNTPPTTEPTRVAPAMRTTDAPTTAPHAPLTRPLYPSVPVAATATARKRGRWVELLLWGAAVVLVIVALVAIVPVLFPNLLGAPSTTPNAVPTSVAISNGSPTAPPTETVLPTDEPLPTPIPTLAPLVLPPPPEGGRTLTLLPLTRFSGWLANDDDRVHWGEPNVIAGSQDGRIYEGYLQFDLGNLPAGTEISFAALELTGRDAIINDPNAQWQIELVDPLTIERWFTGTPEEMRQVKTLGTIGEVISATEVGRGVINRLILSDVDRQLIAQQFPAGRAVMRIRGPEGADVNAVSWQATTEGNPNDAPQLHLVVLEGQYTVVTNTPEPTNVLTAAAQIVRGTQQAQRNGTPTAFPPGVATATPGGERSVIDSETAIPGNAQTSIARNLLATAVAITTGTYTPTPRGQVIQFPTNTPVIVPPSDLSTPTPEPEGPDLLLVEVLPEYRNKILALSTYFGDEAPGAPILVSPDIPATSPDANIVGRFTGETVYKAVEYREQFSPDRTRQIIYLQEQEGPQQIGFLDLNTNERTQLTRIQKGIAYDGAWSADGGRIAFVSTEINNADEIYIYDFSTQQSTCVTCGTTDPRLQPFNKHPSFSPDGTRIAFWSSRSGTNQLWIIDTNGQNLTNISASRELEINPVWVK